MNKKNDLQVSGRRQFKLCLLSCLVVWSLSSIVAFENVEETYRFLIVFGFVSFCEAIVLAPHFFAFYLINQKQSFQRTGFLGSIRHISLGGALGLISGLLQGFFDMRGIALELSLLFAGCQGVILGALYFAFQLMGIFKTHPEQGEKLTSH